MVVVVVLQVAEYDLEKALSDANADPDVHGILIYYPVFGEWWWWYGRRRRRRR